MSYKIEIEFEAVSDAVAEKLANEALKAVGVNSTAYGYKRVLPSDEWEGPIFSLQYDEAAEAMQRKLDRAHDIVGETIEQEELNDFLAKYNIK